MIPRTPDILAYGLRLNSQELGFLAHRMKVVSKSWARQARSPRALTYRTKRPTNSRTAVGQNESVFTLWNKKVISGSRLSILLSGEPREPPPIDCRKQGKGMLDLLLNGG
jgi:hypothetical protein